MDLGNFSGGRYVFPPPLSWWWNVPMIDSWQAGEDHNEFTSPEPVSSAKPEVAANTQASQVQGEGQLRFRAALVRPRARREQEYLTCVLVSLQKRHCLNKLTNATPS
jgi:hypothetical protein